MKLPTFIRIPKIVKSHKYIAVFLLIALGIMAFIFWPKKPEEVQVQKAKRGNIVQTVASTGKVASDTSVSLNFLTAGTLSFAGAQKGQEVEQYQTIASLDQRSVRKNLESTLRDYAKQRNMFENTKDTNENSPVTDAVKRILEDNQYDLEKAVISVELQNLARDQSVLVSPIAGIVTRSDAEIAGVNVSPTTTFTIEDPLNLVFKIDIDEADIGKIKLAQVVKITFDAYPDQSVNVPVESIDFASHQTDTGGNVYTVEALLPPNNNFTYRIGMSGDAEVIVAERKFVTSVPIASVVDNKYIYVKKENVYEKRKVTTGLESDTEVEIKSGLKEGEIVALEPEKAEKQLKKKNPIFG